MIGHDSARREEPQREKTNSDAVLAAYYGRGIAIAAVGTLIDMCFSQTCMTATALHAG